MFRLGLGVNKLICRKRTPGKNVVKILVLWKTQLIAFLHPQSARNHHLRPQCGGLHAFLILVVLVVTTPHGELIGQVDEDLTIDPTKL
jgi:hypothetical protein